MIFRSLDKNDDWTFGNGTSNYATGNNAIGLNIATRLRSWVGDCFFALNAGIDYTNRLGRKNQKALLENDIKRSILQSFGVTRLNSASVSLNAQRLLNSQYSVDTIFSANYVQSVQQGAMNA